MRVHYTSFNDGRWGATQGNTIWLEKRLLQAERRCTIQHEQIHLERGDTCNDPKSEALVRQATAKRLINLHDLVEAAKWAVVPEEIADELWVTLEVLEDRVKGMTVSERVLVNAAIARAWHHD